MELLSSSMQRRAEGFQRQTEISLAGEQLRLRLHNAKLIRDRCHHTLTYPSCCSAKDVVDWLIEHQEAPDRETAISIMQKLVESNIIHHVCDEHSVFKDAKLFYRFRNDDGTLSPTKQMKIVVRSQRIYEILASQEDSILQVREEGSQRYRRTFFGAQMLDWLVKNGEVASRGDGEMLCRAMLEYGIIQPVSGHYHFSDSDLLFQFCINFRRRRKLIEVLNDPSQCRDHRQDSPDSPFCLRKLGSELPHGSFVCAGEPKPAPQPLKRSCSSGLWSPVTYCHFSANKPTMALPSVLKVPVTVEELLAPGAPYIRKTLNIVGDDVGWGFVVRGAGPCHVQAVDPGGPAAAAGMKIRQFIRSVNGINCLNLQYQTIYKHIVAGPRLLILEILEPID
ncbi:PREDICTED: DEP domain-containing mTOR-interacting protein-like [Nanorana parkeri]|uniref:DEP domain-containing mTOR-interacting protein-like n=1 Tax=Nanorana parkeri TaxID=125878 RepID=UPI0008540DA1|nr:PREDICTED: DEP domain-containing mTOR-interacting protein-like [Nanorana parkeri]